MVGVEPIGSLFQMEASTIRHFVPGDSHRGNRKLRCQLYDISSSKEFEIRVAPPGESPGVQ